MCSQVIYTNPNFDILYNQRILSKNSENGSMYFNEVQLFNNENIEKPPLQIILPSKQLTENIKHVTFRNYSKKHVIVVSIQLTNKGICFTFKNWFSHIVIPVELDLLTSNKMIQNISENEDSWAVRITDLFFDKRCIVFISKNLFTTAYLSQGIYISESTKKDSFYLMDYVRIISSHFSYFDQQYNIMNHILKK